MTRSPKGNRRGRKWVRADIQAKVFVATLSVGLATASVFLLAALVDSRFRELLIRPWATSLLIALPFAFWVARSFIFTVCGPIYRFRHYLDDLPDGRWDQPCRLRQGDELHDVNDALNAAMRKLVGCIRSQQRLLTLAQERLEANGGDDALRAEIAEHCANVARRFESPAAPVTGSIDSDEEGQHVPTCAGTHG